MLIIEFICQIGLKSLTGGHLGCHLGTIFNKSTLGIKQIFHFNRLYDLITSNIHKNKIKMIFIEYVGQIGLKGLAGGHFGRHL